MQKNNKQADESLEETKSEAIGATHKDTAATDDEDNVSEMFCVHQDDFSGIYMDALPNESLQKPHYLDIVQEMRYESDRRADFNMDDMRKSQV